MAHYGICPISIAPLRSTPSNRSEMLSQLLFGEVVEILELKGRQWVKVRCCNDNFVAWMAVNQLKALTPAESERYQTHFAYSLELFQPAMAGDHFLPITLGAHLPNFDGMRFELCETTYTFSGQAVFPDNIEATPEFVVKLARRYLHAPYLWGGRSPMGIDAPGLTQMVFRMAGFDIPREAHRQLALGETVDFVEQALPGDLAFFENKFNRVNHTGIVLPDGQIIHASGRVRIDNFDHFGVFNEELGRYTHHLRVIKRMPMRRATAPARPVEVAEPVMKQVELF